MTSNLQIANAIIEQSASDGAALDALAEKMGIPSDRARKVLAKMRLGAGISDAALNEIRDLQSKLDALRTYHDTREQEHLAYRNELESRLDSDRAEHDKLCRDVLRQGDIIEALQSRLDAIRSVMNVPSEDLDDDVGKVVAIRDILVERQLPICCHAGCGKPVEADGKLFCAHHAYEHPAGFKLPPE